MTTNRSPIQREARIRYKAASALRRALEEARCEGIAEGWDLIETTQLRMEWSQALLRETVAEVQVRNLGAAA